jgi:hypothetical protein
MSHDSELILPPGIPPDVHKAFDFITVFGSGSPKDQSAIDKLNNEGGSFAIIGVIVYNDSSGKTYRSDYCIAHTSTGALMWCPRHNEIH